jgi:hypothetical protein
MDKEVTKYTAELESVYNYGRCEVTLVIPGGSCPKNMQILLEERSEILKQLGLTHNKNIKFRVVDLSENKFVKKKIIWIRVGQLTN